MRTTCITCKMMKMDHSQHIQIFFFKKVNDLNISTEPIQLLEEKVEVNLHDYGFNYGFLDITLRAQGTKEKNRYIELHQNYTFLCIKAY